jgi:hypothetical protein
MDYAMDTEVTNEAASHECIKIRSILEARHEGLLHQVEWQAGVDSGSHLRAGHYDDF